MTTSDLEALRARIDALDDRILGMLAERAAIVRDVARAKAEAGTPTHDPERERRVLDRLVEQGAGSFPSEAIQSVFREVMSACLSLQQPVRVAFLGPEGTFTHQAARDMFGLAVRYLSTTTVDGVVDAVRRGTVAYGVVPIENSTEGAVGSALDALLGGGVVIRRERVLPVHHALMSLAGAVTDIERVYSHPQALAQCRHWLASHLPMAQLVQTRSTSAAAREAAADPAGAALASPLAAALAGLPVLIASVQDRADNATRFVVLGATDAPRTGDDKTTLTFRLRDGVGALRDAIEAFSAAGVDMRRISSRPVPDRRWEYRFVVDVAGHREDAALQGALARLGGRAEDVRVLGSYPRQDDR